MKSCALLVLPFLLFAFACTKPSMATRLEPVLDIDGDKLQAGKEYYVVSAFWGAGGGGLTMRNVGDQLCPLAVVQEPFDAFRGRPLIFTPADPKNDVIHVSSDLNIKFSGIPPPICRGQSTVWKVKKSANQNIQWSVRTGGVEGNPGCETVANWFKIEKSGTLGYKLAFCPSVCDSDEVLCKDIGRYFEDGSRALTLIDKEELPFLVVFLKAPTSSAI